MDAWHRIVDAADRRWQPDPSRDLDAPEAATMLLVGSGRLRAYLVRQTEDGPGPRIHVASLTAGEAIVGGAVPPDGYRVVLRAAPGTDVASVRLDAVAAEDLLSIADAASAWVGRAVSPQPVNDARLLTAGTTELPAGQVVRAHENLVVVAASAPLFLGSAQRRGVDGLTLPAMIPAEATLSAAGTAHIEVVAVTPDLTAQVTAILNARAHLLAWSAAEQQHREELLAQRARSRAARDRETVDTALARLATVIEPRQAAPTRTDAAAQVVRRLCDLQGIDADLTQAGDHVDSLLRAARIPHRRVTLDDDWWRRDCGPLLANLAPAEGADPSAGGPVAVYRVRGHYVLWNPGQGSETRLDAATQARLDRTAVVLYRPLTSSIHSLRRLLAFAWRDVRGDLGLILVAGMVSGLLALVAPVSSATIFGSVVPKADRGQLAVVLAFLLGAAVAQTSVLIVRGMASLRLAGHGQLSLQPAVWHRVLDLPVRFFSQYTTGDLVSRVLGIETVRQLVTTTTLGAVLNLVFSGFSLALLFVYSVPLALVSLALVATTNAALLAISLRQLRYSRVATTLGGRISEQLNEFLSHIPQLRLAGAERRAFAQWTDLFSQQRSALVSSQQLANASITVSTGFSTAITLTLVLVVGVVLQGDLGVGAFMAFSVALGQFSGAMVGLNSSLVSLIGAIPQLERLRPLIAEETESSRTGTVRPTLEGGVRVRHATFRYAEDGPVVLDDLSLEVQPGQFAAIAGPSGSGKSTLMRLLLGFETLDAGSVEYDGTPLDSLDIHHVRAQLGVVLQDIQPIDGTIRDNIADAHTSDEEVWRAARMAGLDEYVRTLPMGLQTRVDGTGVTFSGGQLQRLLLARALARRSRILLLDEATSALDNATQAEVMSHISDLNVTRIVVAHRLSTIRGADRIFYLDGGRITEQGTFDELMAADGRFAFQMRRQEV